jgi:hypothetical protein
MKVSSRAGSRADRPQGSTNSGKGRGQRLETLVVKDLVNDERPAVLGLKKKPVFKVSKTSEEYDAETNDQVLNLSPDRLRISCNPSHRPEAACGSQERVKEWQMVIAARMCPMRNTRS